MNIYDIIVTLLYLVLAYAGAFVIAIIKRDNVLYRKYFIKGLTAKLIGGIGFALVYTYYYSYGGDSLAYYEDAEKITEYFFLDPLAALELLLMPGSVESPETLQVANRLSMHRLGTEFPVVRTAAFANILAMNSYFSTTVVFAALSYVGVWHFYLVFARRYPSISGQLAIAVLFIPSVFFWGSGIMKDSIVLGYLGLMVYGIDKFLRKGYWRFVWLIVAVVSGIIIFYIKAYVIMALAPALVIWLVMSAKDRIDNSFIRASILPLLVVFAVGGVIGTMNILEQYQSKYTLENFYSSAESMQSWHYVEGHNTSEEHGRGSSYSLGDYDPTTMGTLKMLPASINVTFFRPYLWEVKNWAMLANSIESQIMFLFTIFIFIGLGFFRVIRLLAQDPFLLMSFSFALLFAFAVGFSSYNFGALARYKIPCIPFYVATLLILNYKVKEIKMQIKMRRSASGS